MSNFLVVEAEGSIYLEAEGSIHFFFACVVFLQDFFKLRFALPTSLSTIVAIASSSFGLSTSSCPSIVGSAFRILLKRRQAAKNEEEVCIIFSTYASSHVV